MSLFVDIRWTGDKELAAAFGSLPGAVQNRLFKGGMVEAAQPVLQRARALAPRKSGRLAQGLRAKGFRRRGYIGARVVAPSRAYLKIAKGAKGYYPIHQELGSKRNRKHAYLKPAAEQMRTQVLDSIARIIWAQVRAHMRSTSARTVSGEAWSGRIAA